MDAYDAIKAAAASAGVSLNSIGRAMGKPDNYVSNGAARGSSPQCNTAAAMLDACGWSLVAMPRDSVPPDAIVIDPPTRPD